MLSIKYQPIRYRCHNKNRPTILPKPPNYRPNQTNPNKPTPTNKSFRNKPPNPSLSSTNQSRHKTKPPPTNQIHINGYIILAIDGVQPEKGNQTLWILRDQITQTTLLAKNLYTADKDNIATLLKEIKKLGIPVKAVISDGQRSIRLAVKQEFPGVPHQLCHFHFLRNIAKPVVDLDRALKVDLKKKVRGIKPVEQKVANKRGEDKQSTLIYDYCQTYASHCKMMGVIL